jgi:hypothetical protein
MPKYHTCVKIFLRKNKGVLKNYLGLPKKLIRRRELYE